MDYKFKYQPRTYDLWRLSIYGIYSSMTGIVNTIFIVAMAILLMKFWPLSNFPIKILLLLGLSLFTIIQPLMIYLRAKKQVEAIPEGMYIGFNSSGIHIEMEAKKVHVKWKNIRGITMMKKMVIIYISENEGYIMTDNILGKEKDSFLEYLSKRTRE